MNRVLILVIVLSLWSCQKPQAVNLFDGKDLVGWHYDIPEMATDSTKESPFIVRNGLLVSLGNPKGHLITDESYQNYRLSVDYRFANIPGNCGILINVSTPRMLYGMFPKSIEVQMNSGDAGDFWCIGEDISVPEMEKRRGARNDWGTTEGKLRRIMNLTDGSEKPVGDWNSMTIECFERNIKVWVNGILVNDGSGCTTAKGQIALQAEGAEVEFRKIELTHINELTPTPQQ